MVHCPMATNVDLSDICQNAKKIFSKKADCPVNSYVHVLSLHIEALCKPLSCIATAFDHFKGERTGDISILAYPLECFLHTTAHFESWR